MNCALQANILAKYELSVSTMPRRYVRKRVAAWSTEGTWILPWNWQELRITVLKTALSCHSNYMAAMLISI